MRPILFLHLCYTLCFAYTLHAQTLLTQFKRDGKWGYLNSKGEEVIAPKYDKCDEFTSEGLAHVFDEGKKQHGFINTKGEFIQPKTICDNLESYSNGLARAKVKGKWGYLDVDGNLAIPAKYDKATDFKQSHATASIGDKYFVLDTKGTEIPVQGEGIVEVKRFSEKLAPFKTANKKMGFIGVDGKVAIAPQYEGVGYFSAGLAWARTDDKKVGYINAKGEWVIQPLYTQGKDFDQSGMTLVKDGESWQYISKAGTVVKKDVENPEAFSEGLAAAKKEGKLGFLDSKGEWAISPQFEASRDFKNGFAAAKQNGKWGFINTKGEWVIQPKYDAVKDMELVKQ